MNYQFTSELWEYHGKGAWFFVTLPIEIAEDIWFKQKMNIGGKARGFASIPVIVQVGKTEWQTSIFRAKKINSYILPIKSAVRHAEKLSTGQSVSVSFSIR